MRILWFTWKDKKNPLSGGAEVMNEELAKRAVKDGHEVIFLVAAYSGCKKKEVIDGYTVIRIGGRQTIYIAAALYYLKYLRSWPVLIIEEINTVPFLTNIYAPSKKRILFIYQLAREIWFHELPKKMYLLSALGYLCEPLYLRFLSNEICFTESQSTQKDLTSYGFAKKNIHIIPPGTNIQPIESLHKIEKYKHFTVLSLGSIRSMKQTLHQIEAFETIKARGALWWR
jgi:glycosyltransferase involved in cell wall biosynthesis